jgi:hypothetical protein
MNSTAMSGESSASPNKMRYQQQKHSNHMKVGMDKKYPHLSQARLRSGKTFHSDDGSFLHPCSQYPHRASRVLSLSYTSLGPPSSTQSNSEPDPLRIPALFCNPHSFPSTKLSIATLEPYISREKITISQLPQCHCSSI